MAVPAFAVVLGLLGGGCSPAVLPEARSPVPVADTGDVGGGETGIEDVGGVSCDHLPVLIVDAGGASIGADAQTDAWLEVVRLHDGTLEDLDDAPRAWSGPIGIELHGSSSQGYPKKNYRIELRDDEGEDTEVGLLDMPPESDWVLHGPYCDKTLLRNAFAYSLGRALAEDRGGRWQPRTAPAELILDGDYKGVYTVVERVKRDGDRVDIPKPAASAAEGDITGGYIVKIDQHRNEGFDTARGSRIDYHYPRASAITEEQDDYLRAWFDSFEEALAADDPTDDVAGWEALVDGDEWIDHFIVNELAHNVDAYRLSAYLVKDADADGGRLSAGPLWDFDRAFGDVNYCDCWEADGFIIDDLTNCGAGDQFPFWWTHLLSDPTFTSRLRCRWEELRLGVLSDEALVERMEDLAAEIEEAQPRDEARWGTIGTYVDPNYYVGSSWRDELDWMEAWIVARTAWLDEHVPGTCGQ